MREVLCSAYISNYENVICKICRVIVCAKTVLFIQLMSIYTMQAAFYPVSGVYYDVTSSNPEGANQLASAYGLMFVLVYTIGSVMFIFGPAFINRWQQ